MIFDILDYRLLKDIALHVCLSGVPKNLLIFWERRKNEALQVAKRLHLAKFLPTTGVPGTACRDGESGDIGRPNERGAFVLCDSIVERVEQSRGKLK